MRKLRRMLAALMALAMLMTAALSEELIALEEMEEVVLEPIAEELAPEVEEAPEVEDEPEEPAEGEPAGEEPPVEFEEDVELEEINANSDCERYGHEWGYDEETGWGTGICDVCGASCSHESGESTEKGIVIKAEGDKAVPCDERYHVFKGDVADVTTCDECGMILKKKVTQKGITSKVEHNFEYLDDDFEERSMTCSECGYNRSACQHRIQDREIYCDPIDDSNLEYKQRDATTHFVSGNMSYTDYCYACGTSFHDESGYFENAIEEHYWENGKCVYCGYKTDCKHTNCYIRPDDEGDPYYTQIENSDFHYVHFGYGQKICADCGYSTYVEKKAKEKHVFSEENPSICKICGYKVQASSVSIDTPAKTELNIGETLNLSAKIAPENALSDILWFSSNHAVATVSSEGVVTAVGAGTTNITAKTENGKSSKALKLTVVDPLVPTKLTLSQARLERNVGEALDLTSLLTVEPAGATKLKWSSKNDWVVHVDAETGAAKVRNAGTTTITVTSSAGGKKPPKASLSVTVKDPEQPTGIQLEPAKPDSMTTDSAPLQLTAKLLPEGTAKGTVTWSSKNEAVAKVDPETGLVTPVGKGQAKIVATLDKKTTKGKAITKSVTVKVTSDAYLPGSIRIPEEQKELKLSTDSGAVQVSAQLLDAEGKAADEKYGGLNWSVKDKYVAEVDATGKVTPKAAGETTLTVTAQKKNAKNKPVKETVKLAVEDPHAITDFKLDKTGTQKLYLGGTLQLTPVFGKEGETSAVTYKASKQGIVEIDEAGLVKPLKEGTVKITATTEKKVGTGRKAKVKSATVTVQVIDPKRPKEIAIDNAKAVEEAGLTLGQIVQLTCTITAEDGTQSKSGVKWTSSKTKNALVDDEGRVYALKSGVTVKITATTDEKGINGKAKSATITLRVN